MSDFIILDILFYLQNSNLCHRVYIWFIYIYSLLLILHPIYKIQDNYVYNSIVLNGNPPSHMSGVRLSKKIHMYFDNISLLNFGVLLQ